MEDFYDFDNNTYNEISKLTKLNFIKHVRNSGIVFKELLDARSLSRGISFYVFCYEEGSNSHSFRFKDGRSFLVQLKHIAKRRLKILERKHTELMRITDSEAYGNNYFEETEMNPINQESLKGLLKFLEEKT